MNKKFAGNAASYLIASLAIMSLSISMLGLVGPSKLGQKSEQLTINKTLNDIAENYLKDTTDYIESNSSAFFKTTPAGARPGWGSQAYIDNRLQLKAFIVPEAETEATSVLNILNNNTPSLRTQDRMVRYNGQNFTIRSRIEHDATAGIYGLKRFVTNTQDKAMLVTVTSTIINTGQTIRKSKLITLPDEEDCTDDSDLVTTPATQPVILQSENYVPGRISGNYFQIGNSFACDSFTNITNGTLNCQNIKPYYAAAAGAGPNNVYLLSSSRTSISDVNTTQWTYTTFEVTPYDQGYIITYVGYTPTGTPPASPFTYTHSSGPSNGQTFGYIQAHKQIYGTSSVTGDNVFPLPDELKYHGPGKAAGESITNVPIGNYIKTKLFAQKKLQYPYTSSNVVVFRSNNKLMTTHISWTASGRRLSNPTSSSALIKYANIRPVTYQGRSAEHSVAAQRGTDVTLNDASDAWDFNTNSGLLTVATTTGLNGRPGIFVWKIDARLNEDTTTTCALVRYPDNINNNHLLPFQPIARGLSTGLNFQAGGSVLNPFTGITRFDQIQAPTAENRPIVFTAGSVVGGVPVVGVLATQTAPGQIVAASAAEPAHYPTRLLMSFSDAAASNTRRGGLLDSATQWPLYLFEQNGIPHWIAWTNNTPTLQRTSQYIYRWDPKRFGLDANNFKNTLSLKTSNGAQFTGEFNDVNIIGPRSGSPVGLWTAVQKVPEITDISATQFAIRSNNKIFVISGNSYIQLDGNFASPLSDDPLKPSSFTMQYLKPYLYFSAKTGTLGGTGKIRLYRHNLKSGQTEATAFEISDIANGESLGNGTLLSSRNLKRLYMIKVQNSGSSNTANLVTFSPTCRKRQSLAGELEGFTRNGYESLQWSDSSMKASIKPIPGDSL